ncbi:MAG: hypothetical protein Q7T48_10575 [Cellvibrio sp.]|uniref:hypothetical protein n=1 Tax=Cellvibrio sp. TaxID=1965322 RepID=UPI00271B02D0|nr:hypothetical protein [Cellvibrio sp.]
MKYKVVSLLVLLVIAFFGARYWSHRIETYDLSYVPKSFGVSKILYNSQKSLGFGPGGNETGIIIYELPVEVAEKIMNGGLAYLNGLPQQPGNTYDWHGRFHKWGETPLLLHGDDGTPRKTLDHEIGHYLDRYGFGIELEKEIEREINSALSSSKSFYSFGRIGFILVIPKSRKVIFAYNG